MRARPGIHCPRNPGAGEAWQKVVPDRATRHALRAQYAGSGGDITALEIEMRAKDGVMHAILWSGVASMYPVPGWRGWAIGIDITERKRAETALRDMYATLELRVTERTAELQASNRRLQEQIRERELAEQSERGQRVLSEALRDITAALNSTLDLDEVFERLLDTVGRVVPNDAADIMLIEEERARIVRSRGYTDRGQSVDGIEFDIAETPNLAQAFETGRAVVIPDIRDQPKWRRLSQSNWIRSHINTPIKLDDHVIGFLKVNSAQPGFFSAEDGDRLLAFADQTAIAVRNARLFAQAQDEITQRRRAELALRRSEEQLRATFDALADGVNVVDQDLRITLVNRAYRAIAQESGVISQPIGRTPFEVFPFLPPTVRDEYLKVFETGEVLVTDEQVTLGQTTLFTETRKIPILGPNGYHERSYGRARCQRSGARRRGTPPPRRHSRRRRLRRQTFSAPWLVDAAYRCRPGRTGPVRWRGSRLPVRQPHHAGRHAGDESA